MNENRILLLICMSICSSFLGLYVYIGIRQWSQYEQSEREPIKTLPFPSQPDEDYRKLPFNAGAVVASAITSITKSPVITYYEYLSRGENDTRLYEQLKFEIFYKTYLSGGVVSSHNSYDNDNNNENITFNVYFESLTGVKLFIGDLNGNTTVQELKVQIQKNGIPDNISLVFNGQRLLNTAKLGTYNIGQDDLIYFDIGPHNNSFYSIKYFNQLYFSNSDHYLKQFKSHHKHHKRCEWKRIPLIPSVSKEKNFIDKSWPISYHGTSTRHARTIADDGFIHSMDHKFDFSHGIYTTPSIKLASSYAQPFTYDGSKYLIIFQNRVNPKTLIKIPHKKGSKYWVSPSVDDVKPYGLLIKKIGYCK